MQAKISVEGPKVDIMHKKVVNSPGMKAALNASRLENAVVRGKVESFENKKVQRIKCQLVLIK